ncbi:dihydrodipicolinate synthase [Photobacterium sp. DNB23_23_1]
MKRIFEVTVEDTMKSSPQSLLAQILHSEGRTLMAETVVSCDPYVDGVSNPELASAFGADMITLNNFDVLNPFIAGLYDVFDGVENLADELEQKAKFIRHQSSGNGLIKQLKSNIGRYIGCNLEPVPSAVAYTEGYKVNSQNLLHAVELGLDYVVITGNPNTYITEDGIMSAIVEAKQVVGENVIVIAGKMHGAGTGCHITADTVHKYCESGADIVMIPAPYTTPGMSPEHASDLIDVIHSEKKLALCAMGTSQESANKRIIEKIAISSKMAGADIVHIGDAGFCGIANPENIKNCSIVIRGKRHTYRRMAFRR